MNLIFYLWKNEVFFIIRYKFIFLNKISLNNQS